MNGRIARPSISLWDRVYLAHAGLAGVRGRYRGPFLLGSRPRRASWLVRLRSVFGRYYVWILSTIFLLGLGALVWLIIAGTIRPTSQALIAVLVACAVFGFFAVLIESPHLRLARHRRTAAFGRCALQGEPPMPEDLLEELETRSSLWLGQAAVQTSARSRNRFVYLDRTSRALMCVLFGASFAFWLSVTLRISIPIVGLYAIVPATLVPVIMMRRRLARAHKRLQSAIQNRSCPDCGYPLGELPPAIATDRTGAPNSGPLHCPECGTRWPLVPPPIPPGGWGGVTRLG